LELIGNQLWLEAKEKEKEKEGTGEMDAQMCVLFDKLYKDKALDQRQVSNVTSAPSSWLSRQRPLALGIGDDGDGNNTNQHETDAPLWPQLPSGPSSPNFTSFTTRQHDTLPPGRVLSGFSDINFQYSSSAFSIDINHGHGQSRPRDQGQQQELGVIVDCSPTIPTFPLDPVVSPSDHDKRSRTVSPPPPRPARARPLPLSLSPYLSLSNTNTSSTDANDKYLIDQNTGVSNNQSQSVIKQQKESASSSPKDHTAGYKDNKHPVTSRQPDCPRPSPPLSQTHTPKVEILASSHLALPLEEIGGFPSNDNQYPSARDKGISDDTSTLLAQSRTSTRTIATAEPVSLLASPISIYSQHNGPSLSPKSQASMPLRVDRSQSDWDHPGKLTRVNRYLLSTSTWDG
jgi:hypothetical protein